MHSIYFAGSANLPDGALRRSEKTNLLPSVSAMECTEVLLGDSAAEWQTKTCMPTPIPDPDPD